MDDYFKTIDPATVPRTPEGEMDLESPRCMDMELLNKHFTMLSKGERIFVPKYEFSRKMRVQSPSKSIKLGKDEIVIFEGIHAHQQHDNRRASGGVQALHLRAQRRGVRRQDRVQAHMVPSRAAHGARL